MSENEHKVAIRRILIALDASPASLAALEAAAELAARLDADLLGLFIEDINLLRLSDLPLASEVGLHSAAINQINREQVEQRLRAQANQARRALADIAQRSKLRTEFRVARGPISTELLTAALDTDLIIMGKAGWSQRKKLGSTARSMVKRSPGHTMFLQHGAHIAHSVGVIYDGSPLAAQALGLAASLMPDPKAGLSVLILAQTIDLAQAIQPEVEGWLLEHHLVGHIHWVHGPQGERLAHLVQGEHLGILVLPAHMDALQEEELEKFLSETSIPVLLVHP
jgi:nucleotide-binding universal stress UspA family protein